MIEQASRTLPAYALYPATLVLLLTLGYAVSKTKPSSGKFLIAIVWLRYVMQAYHEVAHAPSFAGLSLNALVSLGVCVAGCALLAPRLSLLTRLPFVLALMAAIAISGLINGMYAAMFETLLKWVYFIIIALSVYDCVQRMRGADVLGTLLWAFAPPLLFQALSIGLGVSKASESDGSVSYIGGFNHEAAFSIVLVTCFTVATLAPRVHPLLRFCILAVSVAGIFAANYRTSLIALAPIALGFFAFGAAGAFVARQRPLVSLAAFVLVTGAGAFAAWLLRERLTDLLAAIDLGGKFGALPSEFTQAEMDLMSGRLYLWSLYLDAYRAGDDLQILFGFGPDAWTETFGLYAHNTLISYLYEFGAFGACLIALVWISMLLRAGAIRDPWARLQLLFTHLGFIVLNFATMPHWQLEGMILYGLICGYTLAVSARTGRRELAVAYPPSPLRNDPHPIPPRGAPVHEPRAANS